MTVLRLVIFLIFLTVKLPVIHLCRTRIFCGKFSIFCGPGVHYSVDLHRPIQVYRTGSVKILKTRHKIFVDIRIFVQFKWSGKTCPLLGNEQNVKHSLLTYYTFAPQGQRFEPRLCVSGVTQIVKGIFS